MTKNLPIISCLFVSLLSGCASIIDGHSQEVAVNTNPTQADCNFVRNGSPIGEIPSTPGAIYIDKTKNDLNITCKKLGYVDSTYVDKSGLDNSVLWNIVLGGLIGVGIDSASGAINQYDSPVNITLPKD